LSDSQAKLALITGGSRGIGAAIARTLAGVGYNIWLNYHSNHEAAETVKADIEASGRECRLLPFDVSSSDQTREALNPLLEEQAPDVLVNNAGINRDGLLVFMNDDDWHSVTNTTLSGFYNVTKIVLFEMLKHKRGRIINISSLSGQSGLPGQTNYAAAKAGLIGATKSLALEVARKGVLVNAIAPGLIETDMTNEVPKDRLLPMIPLRRFGTAEEVAGVVEFLCSENASYITGEVISVNGGMYV